MTKQISRTEAIATIARAREAVCDSARLQDLKDDYQTDSVADALADAYAGVQNGFLAQVCEAITGQRLEVVGTASPLLPCPCCSRRTLRDRQEYCICDYCFWEDDGTVNEESISSVNRASMVQVRELIRAASNRYDCAKWPL